MQRALYILAARMRSTAHCTHPAGLRRHLLETRFGTIHAVSRGSGGIPLVLLHMSPLSCGMFRRVLPLLARDRLVVCPDRIGFGYSDPPPRALAFPEIAEATLDALDGLAIEAFDAAGIHTGGSEAIELAAVTAPGRVRRAVAIGLVAPTAEETLAHRTAIVPPRRAGDGSHLRWYWDYWLMVQGLREGRPAPDLAVVQERVLEHARAGDVATSTYQAVFDHDTVARLPLVRCPCSCSRRATSSTRPRCAPGRCSRPAPSWSSCPTSTTRRSKLRPSGSRRSCCASSTGRRGYSSPRRRVWRRLSAARRAASASGSTGQSSRTEACS